MFIWILICRIRATIAALPSLLTSGRLLLLLESTVVQEVSSKKGKKESIYPVGTIVDAEVIFFFPYMDFILFSLLSRCFLIICFLIQITEIRSLEVLVSFGGSCRGRVHITEVCTILLSQLLLFLLLS